MSKFGLPWEFWVKVINVNFQLEKYMQFKENDVFIFFSCSINVTVTSQNDVPYFHINQTVYIC